MPVASALGHRKADALFAVEQRFEELLLLIFRAMGKDGHHRGIIGALRVHRQRAQHALAKLHLHQRVGERPQSHAAIFLRHERAPQALRACFLAQIGEHLVERLGIQLLFRGNAFVVHPFAHLFADRFGLGRDFEIERHGISSFDGSCCLDLVDGITLPRPASNDKQSLKR
jgi:hypothetical protein